MKKLKQIINNDKLSKKVLKAQQGDKKALEYIVSETSGYVYYYCVSLLKDDEKARDAVQDIFIKVLNNLGAVKNPVFFLGWLKSIASNYCNSILNVKYYDKDLTDDFVENDIQYIPDKKTERSELCENIRNAVDKLPLLQKECILLYYYQQLSIREIAAALNIKEGTVKSRLYYARKTLKDKLKDYKQEDLLNGISPLNFVSYSLLKEAEKFKFKTDSGSVFALRIDKPFIDFSTPIKASGVSAGILIKAVATVLSVSVIGVGGVMLYSSYNKSANNNITYSSSKKKTNNSIFKYAENYINNTYNEYDFSTGIKKLYYIKKKNYKGITATFNNYDCFKYSKNPIWVVVVKNKLNNYKQKIIPAKGISNDEIWRKISTIAKNKKLAWRDKKGNVWIIYKKYNLYSFVEIDSVTKENLGSLQILHTDTDNKKIIQDLKDDFRYAYKKELEI